MIPHAGNPPSPHLALADLLTTLPQVSRPEVALRSAFADGGIGAQGTHAVAWITDHLGTALEIGGCEWSFELVGSPEAGVTARVSRSGGSSPVGLGLEMPLAHTLIDALLGSPRNPGAERRQFTPVEWGLLTYIFGKCVARLNTLRGHLAWRVDQVGQEAFQPDDPGSYLTLRWPIRLSEVVGSAWLWLPESVAWQEVGAGSHAGFRPAANVERLRSGWDTLTSTWTAEFGRVTLARGPATLRVGGILPFDGPPPQGTPASPSGLVELGLRSQQGRSWYPTRCAPLSGGGRLVVDGPRELTPATREPYSMTTPESSDPRSDRSDDPGHPASSGLGRAATGDSASPMAGIPVTLVVELGRVNLTVQRLADLKEGDVIELNRHAREPVELTSGGKLVARGELVLIDTELGIRVTSVLL